VTVIAFALAHSAFKQMLPSTNVSSIGSEHCICLIITVQYAPTSSASLHPLCPPIEHLNGTHHHVVGLLVMFVFCNWRAARTSPNHHIHIIQ